jgi:hypothetical protein
MLIPRELHWITLDLSRVAPSAVGRSSMLHQPAMLARKGGKDRIYLANRSCVKYLDLQPRWWVAADWNDCNVH